MDPLEIDIPQFFLCPISLEIMKDPVTVSTGITYDRSSIEKWLLLKNDTTCPVTKQPLDSSFELIPNHTLRNMIRSWCMLDSRLGIDGIPAPKTPITRSEVLKIINEAKQRSVQSSQHVLVACLKKLRRVASESAANRWCLEDSGVAEFLASVINNHANGKVTSIPGFFEEFSGSVDETVCASESRKELQEALSLLHSIHVSDTKLKNLLNEKVDFDIADSLTKLMHGGHYEARTYSVMLMKSIFESADPKQLVGLSYEIFSGSVRILNDRISPRATKCALQLLIKLCQHGRYRQRAVEAGAVAKVVELLLDHKYTASSRVCEMAMTLLDVVCQCAEGRAELVAHPAGLAVVSKKILRISNVTSEKAISVLLSVGKFCGTHRVVQELLEVGAVRKLCFVLHLECGGKLRDKASELLKLHARVWKTSACLPLTFFASNPA